MPNLVSGHVRFTEEDTLLSDYKEKINEEGGGKKSKEELCKHLIRQFKSFLNTIENNNTSCQEQKTFLSEALFNITSLAYTLGFTMEDLIKEKN